MDLTPDEDAPKPSMVEVVRSQLQRKLQYYLDCTTVYPYSRWLSYATLLGLFFLRVYLLQGWFIIAYGLGIYLLNLFIGFLTPQADPDGTADVSLPTGAKDEFKPFVRKVPEFVFWWQATRATLLATAMTFFQLFNIPVFWPILLGYFIILTGLTLKKQYAHMRKHGYVPWSRGKVKYASKDDK